MQHWGSADEAEASQTFAWQLSLQQHGAQSYGGYWDGSSNAFDSASLSQSWASNDFSGFSGTDGAFSSASNSPAFDLPPAMFSDSQLPQHQMSDPFPQNSVDSHHPFAQGADSNGLNTPQLEFDNLSSVPSRPPSSASEYSLFDGLWNIPTVDQYASGPASSESDWEVVSQWQSDLSGSVSTAPLSNDSNWHNDEFWESSRPPSASPTLDFDDSRANEELSPPDSVQPDSSSSTSRLPSNSNDGNSLYELTPDEIDAAIGPIATKLTSNLARDSWPWRDSTTVWNEPSVTSKVVDFPDGLSLNAKTKVFHVELVRGIPSHFPIPEERTAFIVCADDLSDAELQGQTIDAILKDHDPHSYGGSTGPRAQADSSVIGSIFGLDSSVRVAVRRAEHPCRGVVACKSLDKQFLYAPRRYLNPEHRQALIDAEMRTRELQDTTPVGRVLAYERSLQSFSCKAILANGTTCKGKAHMVLAKQPVHDQDYIIVCSHQDQPCTTNSGRHTVLAIPKQIDQDILFKPIVEEEDTDEVCPRVISRRQGFKGKSVCPYNHMKDGVAYKAPMVAISCKAVFHVYCPVEDLYPDLAYTAVVVPKLIPHTHPPPPENKINRIVANLYMECVRKLGDSATPAKVDRAPTTIALLGTTPALFHPALANRDTRIRLVQQVKQELNASTSTGDVKKQIAVYLAEQQAKPPSERYLQSSIVRDGRTIIFGIHPELIKNIHRVRTLDCDTTFKPVVGSMNIFEVNAWLAAINEGAYFFLNLFGKVLITRIAVTLGRVWMEVHDRAIYKQVWEEIQRLVITLTGRPILFKGIHKRGTILGLNADMEAAPLLGFGDAFLPTVDREELRGVVTSAETLLPYVLRVCHTHVFRGIPEAPHLSREEHSRLRGFVSLQSPEAVEDFKIWIANLPDPDGTIKRWWKHKIMHVWLLAAIIQCLSCIALNDWHSMPATTNLGEAQHARNNAETGTQMGIIESFKKYAEYDARRAAEIAVKLATGNLNNNQNELVHRYASSNRRHAAAANKATKAQAADERVVALTNTKAQIDAELKQAKAEAKSNSSGRVRVRRPTKEKSADNTSEKNSSAPAASPPEPESSESTQRQLRSREPQLSSTVAPITTAPKASKRKADATATTAKRRKKVDPLEGWAIELVPGDKSTMVTPREYAEKEPEEFAAQYPNYVKYL
ncbi:hypothetical protein R3P38DRAFT_3234088 [Favolaschia claudopus]|uniref:Uncharacterized protein n=1 Tax=Favolaschia claudopus TaxID=2862362 RepID=A0AAV9ZH90_9AGAR